MHQNGAREDPGFVYVAQNQHLFKIGVSYHPKKRLARLRCGSSSAPVHVRTANWRDADVTLVCVIPTDNMKAAERIIWDRFAGARCDNYLGFGTKWQYKSPQQSEWFTLSAEDVEWLKAQDKI